MCLDSNVTKRQRRCPLFSVLGVRVFYLNKRRNISPYIFSLLFSLLLLSLLFSLLLSPSAQVPKPGLWGLRPRDKRGE